MPKPHATHEVFNQVPDLVGINLFDIDATLQRVVTHFDGGWGRKTLVESRARVATERMALLLQASLLLRFSDPAVGNAFVSSRLNPRSLAYGSLDDPNAIDALLGVIAFA